MQTFQTVKLIYCTKIGHKQFKTLFLKCYHQNLIQPCFPIKEFYNASNLLTISLISGFYKTYNFKCITFSRYEEEIYIQGKISTDHKNANMGKPTTKSKSPHFRECPFCHREFGSRSLQIHMPRCRQKVIFLFEMFIL